MIVEGIITTEDENGKMHVAPIGPHVDPDFSTWTLYPFQTSTTFSHLHRSGRAVFHITDDAFLLTASVLGLGNSSTSGSITDSSSADSREKRYSPWVAQITRARSATFRSDLGWVLDRCHRYVGLQITQWDTSAPRATAVCGVVSQGSNGDFWGWNRAKHSLLELAILVSRKHLTDRATWNAEWERHRIIIHKTAGPEELDALALLTALVLP